MFVTVTVKNKIMRQKPYTKKGISRVPCAGCGQPSTQQWQICSLNNQWMGLCNRCDIDLNKAVLRIIGVKNWIYIITAYRYGKKVSNRTLKEITGL